jgi:hypothetical protein
MLIVPFALLRTYGRMVGSVRAGYTLLTVAGALPALRRAHARGPAPDERGRRPPPGER